MGGFLTFLDHTAGSFSSFFAARTEISGPVCHFLLSVRKLGFFKVQNDNRRIQNSKILSTALAIRHNIM